MQNRRGSLKLTAGNGIAVAGRRVWSGAIASIIVAATFFMGVANAQQTITGVGGGGALYEFIVPEHWNGQLIVYAHGTVPAGNPIALPSSPLELAAFQAIASQGFALAISSFGENGWAEKDGAQSVHQLEWLFTSRVAKPSRTYLVGVSLGGLITLDLSESFPGQYDGALSLCGVVAGTAYQFQRVGDARVLFDYFFPDVLPGDLLHMPNLDFSPGSPTFLSVLTALQLGLIAPGQPTLQFANAAGLAFTNPNELLFSALEAVGGYLSFNELLQRTGGHNFYDNRNTVYSGSANDAALNAGVQRFKSEPAGVNYVSHYYTPTGKLHIPVLTVHTTLDPTAPFIEEAIYAGVAAANGSSGLLVQQSVNRFGHCNFKPQELVNAVQSLVLWVNFGVKPNGGDVTVP